MKFLWNLDHFDSKIFGFKVAKITQIESQDYIADLINELSKNKIKYATYRVASNSFSIIRELQNHGFVLVDGLISLTTNPFELKIGSPASEIREATKKDLTSLRKTTSGLYLLSRIYNDPLISRDKADEFFVKWVENSISGEAADLVLVWEDKGEILGYVTLQKKGQIPLIGVSKEARGRGIAKKLIEAVLYKFKEWMVKEVIIETQMSNIPALRVDQDCGFKVVNSYLTFRWAKND